MASQIFSNQSKPKAVNNWVKNDPIFGSLEYAFENYTPTVNQAFTGAELKPQINEQILARETPFTMDGTMRFRVSTEVATQPQPEKTLEGQLEAGIMDVFDKFPLPSNFQNVASTMKSAGLNFVGAIGNSADDVKDAFTGILDEIKPQTEAKKTPQEEQKAEEDKIKKVTAEAQMNRTQQEIDEAHSIREALPEKKAQIITINEKLGLSTGFERVTDSTGQIRADFRTLLEQKDAEIEEGKNRRTKAQAYAFASGSKKTGASGPSVNMKTTMEDQNMNRPG